MAACTPKCTPMSTGEEGQREGQYKDNWRGSGERVPFAFPQDPKPDQRSHEERAPNGPSQPGLIMQLHGGAGPLVDSRSIFE